VGLYVCNASFGPYGEGEYVEAEAPLVSYWIEAQFLSPVDDEGTRLVEVTPPTTDSVEQPGVFAPPG